jgi:hypothetical protein
MHLTSKRDRKPRWDWAVFDARHNRFFRYLADHPGLLIDLDSRIFEMGRGAGTERAGAYE